MRVDPLSALLHRSAAQHGPAILMYHAVSPGYGAPAWPWAVSLRRFRDQLDFLAGEGYATPTINELVAGQAEAPAGRTVAITFDDGYADNLAACEELHKRGMRATWFIVTGSIGKPPAWPAADRPTGRLLNDTELHHLLEAGMEVGSHTISHIRLTELGASHLRHELEGSRTDLATRLGRAVTSLAYPYGAWDARCIGAVRQAGYAAACTTRTGWALRDGDPYQLRRLTMFNSDTASSLARKLHFATNDVSWGAVARHLAQRSRTWLGIRAS